MTALIWIRRSRRWHSRPVCSWSWLRFLRRTWRARARGRRLSANAGRAGPGRPAPGPGDRWSL